MPIELKTLKLQNEPKPSKCTHLGWCSELPSQTGETFDPVDAAATKQAVKSFLSLEEPEPALMLDLPVQDYNPTANQLFQLLFKARIESDSQQNIKSQLYQDKTGKIIFCMDARHYDETKEIDSSYSYARYGLGLYISQYMIYSAYGVEETAFIAKNAQRFYERFMAAMHDFMQTEKDAKKLARYAKEHLSDVSDSIAEQLTGTLGEKNEEFKDVDASIKALGTSLHYAHMACEPIADVAIERFSYDNPNLSGSNHFSEEYVHIVHPKPAQMTEDIKRYYNEPKEGEHQFLEALTPCEKKLVAYLKPQLFGGKVTLPSQKRGALLGVKNAREFELLRVGKDEDDSIQLINIGNIVGNSTTLNAFKNVDDALSTRYSKLTLLQLHQTLGRGDNTLEASAKKRGLSVCTIALCGLDLSTPLLNAVREKKVDPLDSKIIDITAAAAKEINDDISFNNLTINYERFAEPFDSRVNQIEGLEVNVKRIKEFKDNFNENLNPTDQERLEIYLNLIDQVLQKSQGMAVDKLEPFMDTIALFAMLCNVYNELVLKYDMAQDFKFILPSINCASGENRTGAAIFHHNVLSIAADSVVNTYGVTELKHLLDEKHYPLRRAIGNQLAKIDVIGKDNENFGSAIGTRGIREQSINSLPKVNAASSVLSRYTCRPEADLKNFVEDVYIPNEKRVNISRAKEIADNDNPKSEASMPENLIPKPIPIKSSLPREQHSEENPSAKPRAKKTGEKGKGAAMGAAMFIMTALFFIIVAPYKPQLLHPFLGLLATAITLLGWFYSKTDKKQPTEPSKLDENPLSLSKSFCGFFSSDTDSIAAGLDVRPRAGKPR